MKILLVAKRSKYEWERFKLNLSHEELLAKYSGEHANLDAIMSSHDRQLEARKLVEHLVGVSSHTLDDFQEVFWRHCLVDGPFKDTRPDMIVVLGGDNSFTAVAQRSYDVPILAINSDPQSSLGYLTKWRTDTFEELGKLTLALKNNQYNIEKWTRLQNDLLPTVPAISEYYLGETKRKDMSRLIIEYRGQTFEQKCSGLIVSTGAGSTGWYHSANQDRTLEENKFAPTDRRASFVITEPFRHNVTHVLKRGDLMLDEELVVHSLNDDGGLISADSWLERDFKRGATARIKLGNPAQVIVP